MTANFIRGPPYLAPRNLRSLDSKANRGKEHSGAIRCPASRRRSRSQDIFRSARFALQAFPDAASRRAPPRPEDQAPPPSGSPRHSLSCVTIPEPTRDSNREHVPEESSEHGLA